MPQAKISRIFVQKGWKNADDEQLVGEGIREIRAVALGVTQDALAIGLLFVGRLFDSGLNAGDGKCKRVEVMRDELKFLGWADRRDRLVRIVDGLEIGKHAEHAMVVSIHRFVRNRRCYRWLNGRDLRADVSRVGAQ